MHLLKIVFQGRLIRVVIRHGVGEAGEAVNQFRDRMRAFGDILCTVEKTADGSVVTAHIRIPKDPIDRYNAAKLHVSDSASLLFRSPRLRVVKSHDPRQN